MAPAGSIAVEACSSDDLVEVSWQRLRVLRMAAPARAAERPAPCRSLCPCR
jgi:hypothetical protein